VFNDRFNKSGNAIRQTIRVELNSAGADLPLEHLPKGFPMNLLSNSSADMQNLCMIGRSYLSGIVQGPGKI